MLQILSLRNTYLTGVINVTGVCQLCVNTRNNFNNGYIRSAYGGGVGEGYMNVGQQIKSEVRRCCITIHWTLWVPVTCVCVEHLQTEFSSTYLKVMPTGLCIQS